MKTFRLEIQATFATFFLFAALVLPISHSRSATVEPPVPHTGGEILPGKKQDPGNDINQVIEFPEKMEIDPPSADAPKTDNQNDGTDTASPEGGRPVDVTPPPIQTDMSKLPVPVARMRELIMEAARSGQIEKLRQLIGSGQSITVLSLGGIEGDPIEFMKSLSGDDQGHEILAILLEVLEAGYVLMDPGTENEIYVWPYFFAWPLDKLTPVQKVELFRIITAGDYEDMLSFGGYIFYRLGITPEGRWQFFVAGD